MKLLRKKLIKVLNSKKWRTTTGKPSSLQTQESQIPPLLDLRKQVQISHISLSPYDGNDMSPSQFMRISTKGPECYTPYTPGSPLKFELPKADEFEILNNPTPKNHSMRFEFERSYITLPRTNGNLTERFRRSSPTVQGLNYSFKNDDTAARILETEEDIQENKKTVTMPGHRRMQNKISKKEPSDDQIPPVPRFERNVSKFSSSPAN